MNSQRNYFLEVVDFYHILQANREKVHGLGNSIQSVENKFKLVVNSFNKDNTSKVNAELLQGLKAASKAFFEKNKSLFPDGKPSSAISLEDSSLNYNDLKDSFLKNMPGYDSADEDEDYLTIISNAPPSSDLLGQQFSKQKAEQEAKIIASAFTESASHRETQSKSAGYNPSFFPEEEEDFKSVSSKKNMDEAIILFERYQNFFNKNELTAEVPLGDLIKEILQLQQDKLTMEFDTGGNIRNLTEVEQEHITKAAFRSIIKHGQEHKLFDYESIKAVIEGWDEMHLSEIALEILDEEMLNQNEYKKD